MNLVREPKFLALFDQAKDGRFLDECWPWPGTLAKGGYGVIWLDSRQHRVSRLVIGAQPEEQALHVCDNPPCVNPSHLQRGTIQENQRDKGRKGRAAKGVNNRGGGRLTEEQVLAIRERLSAPDNPTLVGIGKEFGVSATLIAKIRNGELWSSVK